MQEKLRELIAHCKNTGITNGKWFAGELEAALAASEPECTCDDTSVRGRHDCEVHSMSTMSGYDPHKNLRAASEPAPQPEQIIEIDEDGKVHYPPCSCFTCPQHGELLKAIEQRESLTREHK